MTELPVLQIIALMFYITYISFDLYIYCYVSENLRAKVIQKCYEHLNYKNKKRLSKKFLLFIILELRTIRCSV